MTVTITDTTAAVGPAGFAPLADALVEAAAARRARALDALAAGIGDVAAAPDAQALDGLAARARAMAATEALIAEVESGGTVRSSPVERLVTFQQIAWPAAAGDAMTSLADVPLPREVAAALLAVAAEVVAMVEAEAPPGRHVRLFLASEPEEDGVLVMAIAAHGIDDAPALGGAASRALRRAERLARLSGGDVVRGYRDGLLLVGVTIAPARAVFRPGAGTAA